MFSALLDSTAVILLLVYVGMALIATEFFVKARGIAGSLGLVSMVLYFTAAVEHLSLWMVGLFVVGLTMMIVDGKFVQDGTMAAIGVLLMLVGLVMPNGQIPAGDRSGVCVNPRFVVEFAVVSLLAEKRYWEKLTLRDRFTSEAGYSSINVTYQSLVGQKGRTLTDMRPSGTIEVGGKTYMLLRTVPG